MEYSIDRIISRSKKLPRAAVILLLSAVFLVATSSLANARGAKKGEDIVPCPTRVGDSYAQHKGTSPKQTLSPGQIECKTWKEWKQEEFEKKPKRSKDFSPVSSLDRPINPAFMPLGKTGWNMRNFITNFITAAFNLIPTATAATINQYGNITVDGDLSDWTSDDRINLPLNLPPYLATGDELYGKYVDTPEPTYLIALKSIATPTPIDPLTTFWLNTDQNAATGYQIFGLYGGAEYHVDIDVDSTPYLYVSATNEKLGALDHAYSPDWKILELAIPTNSLSLTSPQAIDVLADIKDTVFLPEDYATGQFTIPGVPEALPPRTDFSKRACIVYSSTTMHQFFSEKAYSQLFMSLQHQAMMAGIPFDLLTEDDLTNIANIVNCDALIFPYFAYIPSAIQDAVHDTLYKAIYKYGIGVMTADNWMTNDETGAALAGDSYRNMEQMLGIGRVDGEIPVDITVNAGDVSHPAMKGYVADELIISYDQDGYSYYAGVPGQAVTTLANQSVTGSHPGVYPAMLATETGGRHVHFATLAFMGDTNLAWQALQWIVYGDKPAVGLNLGRNKSLFLSRNDMDQAQEHDEVAIVDVPLLDLIGNWKANYNFVGSFYIDIGNDPANGQWTDWTISGPLFQNYVALDNEIGTHSWTHPESTDVLTPEQLEFEFNQSMNEISTNIGNTWRSQDIRGGAVPGTPESLSTAKEIIQYLDYLTGGYSGIGAGYPSAFGYLTPDSTKVYFSPNMTFDFTLIEYGVPEGNPPVPTPKTAQEAEQYWQNEYQRLTRHASEPIVLWPWHDFGPTTSADPVTGDGYTIAMYENTIAMVANGDAEFATLSDAAQRIATVKGANLMVEHSDSTITATVNTANAGKFALMVNKEPGQVIQSVANWYAYNTEGVFLDDDGGTFVIQLGSFQDKVSHITRLPMRARLISLNGNGANLSFTFEGKGPVSIALSGSPGNFSITGADSVVQYAGDEIGMNFDTYGLHTGNITLNANVPPTADAGSAQDVNGGDTVTLDGTGSSDPEGAIAAYKWEQIDGTSVTLSDLTASKPTFTAPNEDGRLSFRLTVTDAGGLTGTDTVVITTHQAGGANVRPTADAGAAQDVNGGDTVTLDGTGSSDPEGSIAAYKWEQIEGTSVTLSDSTASKPTLTAPNEDGRLSFRLTVMDAGGLTGTDTVVVTTHQLAGDNGNNGGGSSSGGSSSSGGGGCTLGKPGAVDPLFWLMILASLCWMRRHQRVRADV
jgi:serralysin